MKRVKAKEDGSGTFVRARASSDPFNTTASKTADAPRTWFSLKLHNITDSSVELDEEISRRTKAWVEDQRVIAFGGYFLMVPQYEPMYTAWEKARKRRRRFRDQERHRADAARVTAFKDRFRDAAEQVPRIVQEVIDSSLGAYRKAARRKVIRQAVGPAVLYIGALEMEKLVEEYDCECDGSECLCPTESGDESEVESEVEGEGEREGESEIASEVSEQEEEEEEEEEYHEVERGRKRQRVVY
ncbi:uncharacterized protein PG986_011264 [Apiospora aurea]|uniref:Uncharacterized protein n=1 Tax=Apiospora aurea TaxID=335848 RepID=A0ABR1Q5W8_9PEZI